MPESSWQEAGKSKEENSRTAHPWELRRVSLYPLVIPKQKIILRLLISGLTVASTFTKDDGRG